MSKASNLTKELQEQQESVLSNIRRIHCTDDRVAILGITAILDAEDIKYYVMDEVDQSLFGPIGGTGAPQAIYVRLSDFERAKKIAEDWVRQTEQPPDHNKLSDKVRKWASRIILVAAAAGIIWCIVWGAKEMKRIAAIQQEIKSVQTTGSSVEAENSQ